MGSLLSLTLAGSAQASTPFQLGQVFASIGGGTVNVYDPTTALLVQALNDGTGSYTTGGIFDASQNFFVTDFGSGAISKYDSSGVLQPQFATGLASPESLVFDNSGNLYVGQASGNLVAEFNSAGTRQPDIGPLTTQDRGTDWIDLAADHCTLFYTSEGSDVLRFNKCTNTQLTNFNTVTLPGSNAFALRIRPNGDVLVADSSSVIRLDSAGNVLQTYLCSGLSGCSGGLFALNLDGDNTSFWTGDFNSGNIWRVDIATGNVLQTIATGSGALFGLTISGQINVGSGGGGPSQPPVPVLPTITIPEGQSSGLRLPTPATPATPATPVASPPVAEAVVVSPRFTG
jgi:hypothetical protein